MKLSLRRNPFPPLLIALAFAVLEALLASARPGNALRAFFIGPFASPWTLFTLLDSSAPLLLASLGACLAFRAGIFNLGGEGQAALGLLAGSLVLPGLAGLPALVALPLALLVSAMAGGLLALLSGLLERRFKASVLLTTFLFSQAVIVIVDWAIGGPLRDPGSNLLAMPALPPGLVFPRLVTGLPLSFGPLLALALGLLIIILVKGTRPGFELGLFGLSRRFADTQGLDRSLDLWPLLLSGALSGVAGLFVVLGSAGQAVEGMSAGLGWNGLAISLVAGTDPLLAIPATLFFAYLDAGASAASILSDLSPETAAIMKALVLLFVTVRMDPGKVAGRKGRLRTRGAGSSRDSGTGRPG